MTLLRFFSTKKTGDDAERIAERFLASQGLTLVARNYRSRFGEIDLIMRESETLVFVEVRMRKPLRGKADFGGALASITRFALRASLSNSRRSRSRLARATRTPMCDRTGG